MKKTMKIEGMMCGHCTGRVEKALNALDGVVPQLRSISAGANSVYADVNWDVTLIADFDDADGLAAYASHPDHVAAGAVVKANASGRVATVAAEVWMRPLASVSGTRCTRCTPDSYFSRA